MSQGSFSQVGSELTINIVASASSVELVDAVVDVDEFGSVIGIEILGLLARHPRLADIAANVPTEVLRGDVAVSFDPDADALYVRLREGRSSDQLVTPAAVLFGADDELVQVVVHLE